MNNYTLEKRVSTLEKKIDLIMEHLGIDYNESEDVDPQIMEMLRVGNKIAAIKIYRELTGLGLKEAKDYVDEIESLHKRGMI